MPKNLLASSCGSRGVLNAHPFLQVEAKGSIWSDMAIDERRQRTQIFCFEPPVLLRIGEDLLNQQRVNILSRDFLP